MDDATLVARAVGGDRDAFADIYDRHAGAVLDLATAILRDTHEAAEATLDTFLRAARELLSLRDRSRLRVWLLAVARHEATDRAARRARLRRDGAPPRPPERHPEADRGAEDGMGTLGIGGDGWRPAWDPAEALSERDRALLHLRLRQDLEGDDLGVVLGMRGAAAEARAAKLQGLAEASMGAYLLCQSGGGSESNTCPRLGAMLEGWDGRFNVGIGSRVHRHAEGCEVCQGRRRMLLGRLQAMASLPFLPPPEWLRREVLVRMELAVSPKAPPGWVEGGFPPANNPRAAVPPSSGKRRVAALAALVVLGASSYLVVRQIADDSTVTASGTAASTVPVSTAVPVTATTVRATTVPPAPTSTGPPTTQATPSAPSSTVAAVPGPSPDPPPPPSPSPPPVTADTDPPAIALGADAASAYLAGCPYSQTGVTAEVTDQSPLTSVDLFVRGPDGIEESGPMTHDGGRWVSTIGNFASPGQALFWVEALDSAGNQGRSGDQTLDVFACA